MGHHSRSRAREGGCRSPPRSEEGELCAGDSRAHREHSDLLNAFLARDAAALEALLVRHIGATLDDLREQFAAA